MARGTAGSLARWVGAGLVVVGPVLVGVALFVPEVEGWPWKESEGLRGVPDGLEGFLWVPALLNLVVALSAWLGRDSSGGSRRVAPALLAAALVWPAWWGVPEAVGELGDELPYLGVVAFAAGAAVWLAGAVVLVAVGLPDGDPSPVRWPARVGAGVGGVVLGTLPLLVSGWVLWPEVGEGTTAQAVQAAPVPGRATGTAWTWQGPKGQDVRQVVPAGAGVVVRTADGIHALDGRTGKERWRFQNEAADFTDVQASPDRRTVLVDMSQYGTRVVTLDAMTGQVLAKVEDARLALTSPSDSRLVTDHVFVDPHGSEEPLTAYDLRSGKRRWTAAVPDGCGFADPGDEVVTGSEIVAMILDCEDGGRVVGLDDRTGKVRWRHQAQHLTEITASSDGRLVSLEDYGSSDGDRPVSNSLLDTVSGRLVFDEKRMPGRTIALVGEDWLLSSPDDSNMAIRMNLGENGGMRKVRVPDDVFEGADLAAADDPLRLWLKQDPAPGLDVVLELETLNGRKTGPVAVDAGPIVDPEYDYAAPSEPFLVPAPGAIVAAQPSTGRVVGLR